MKIKLSILLLALTATLAIGQEVRRPALVHLLNPPTSTTPYVVAAITLTNIPVADAPFVPVGNNGIGIFINVAGTNAASTTNATLILEQAFVDRNGRTNVIDSSPNTVNVVFAQNGTTGYQYYTNIANTVANIPNSMVRIRSVQNTNTASIFLTNVYAVIRE